MESEPGGVASAPAVSPSRNRRRRTSVIGVIGEVLITVGVISLLYVAWQLWIGDWIYAAQRADQAKSYSQQWQTDYEKDPASIPTPEPTPTPSGSATPAPATSAAPVILPEAQDAEVFGTMHIPRFGGDYAVAIAGGISRPRTLDPIGIGHYPGTPMPGSIGNVALAAHRTTWGKPFNRIADLHVGDAVVIETPDGWYTYRFRTLEYVEPTAVDVLLPVPQEPQVEATMGYLTMTSCSPMYAMTERIVGYSAFESFTPRSAGAPASLTEAVS